MLKLTAKSFLSTCLVEINNNNNNKNSNTYNRNVYNFFKLFFHISNIINVKKPLSLLITLWFSDSVSFCEYYRLPLLKHVLRVFWTFGAKHPLLNTPLIAILDIVREIIIIYTLYHFLRLIYSQLLAHNISISKIY